MAADARLALPFNVSGVNGRRCSTLAGEKVILQRGGTIIVIIIKVITDSGAKRPWSRMEEPQPSSANTQPTQMAPMVLATDRFRRKNALVPASDRFRRKDGRKRRTNSLPPPKIEPTSSSSSSSGSAREHTPFAADDTSVASAHLHVALSPATAPGGAPPALPVVHLGAGAGAPQMTMAAPQMTMAAPPIQQPQLQQR